MALVKSTYAVPWAFLARAREHLQHLIVMDDNARPDAYWPCYQALRRGFAAGLAGG